MVNSKKLLSLFLAVVMVFSVLSVMASAYTVGPEVAGDLNFKYSVEKVDTVPETAAGSAEYTADNIYAVSVWMQCDNPVYVITAPFHFNKALFSPIMLFDGEVTYPYGAGFGVDDYYSNMGEGTVYAYSEGDYLNNTGMYRANGTTATTKALAKCIGLGNENSEGVGITAELVSPDHPLYNKWGAGLPENTGVMYVNLDVASVTKSAYLNTISGIETSKDWNKMFTFYFETLEGVTANDITGAEFGVYTDDCFTVDGDIDASGYGYFAGATTAKYNVAVPNRNIVGNAVIPYTVYHVKNQIQWNDKDANSVNIGVVAGFKAADIPINFVNGVSDNVTKIGTIYKINGVVQSGELTTNRVYSVNGGESYNFRIVLGNISTETTDTYSVTPYVVYNGEQVYGPEIEITPDDVTTLVGKLS